MFLNATKTLFNLIREINLKSIQDNAEVPVRLVVAGEAELAARLASEFGEAPWVSTLASLSERRSGDLLVRVSQDTSPSEPLPAGGLEVVLGGARPGLPDRVILPNLEPGTLQNILAPALMDKAPDALRLSLARHVPLLREVYARTLIEQTSRTNAVYAASTGVAEIVPLLSLPLNVADLVVLTKNQLLMAYKLALAEGKTGRPEELMKEIISVVGGGFLFRQVARELVGLVPVWGIVPKIAVSYAGTWVIGQTVHLWAAKGETATLKEMRRYYAEALERGRKLAGDLASRVRSRGRRSNSKTETLEQLPPPTPLAEADEPGA
ncbi:MAG TPA: hypothetical protein VGW38_12895 [Chloroflexota bacterium]|nr:hypothetical protein [Chloroflexota bacterium]